MIITSNFKGEKVFNRKGIVGQVILEDDFNVGDLADIQLDEDNKVLKISKTKNAISNILIAKKIGVVAGTSALIEFFFINGGIVVELVEGRICIDDNGSIVALDDEDGIVYGESDNCSWMDVDDLRNRVKMCVAKRYGMDEKDKDVDTYINNMIFTLSLDRACDLYNTFCTKLCDINTSLACGLVFFENKAEVELEEESTLEPYDGDGIEPEDRPYEVEFEDDDDYNEDDDDFDLFSDDDSTENDEDDYN